MRGPRFLLSLFAVFLLVGACTRSSDRDAEALTSRLVDTLQRIDGSYALAFKDLQTMEEIHLGEKRLFHAASTMKTPVMIEVYKQAAAGKLKLQDSIRIDTVFKSIVDGSPYSLSTTEDSEGELYALIGQKRPISDLVYKMITVSSNLATNILIEKVGATNVTQSMRALGADSIQVLRGVEDSKAFQAGLSNRTTARDLMMIFSALSEGTAVSPEASAEMIEVLLDQKFNEIIPAQLPPNVRVAHKTGWITGVHHDSAIIFLPDGRKYVLVLLTDKLTDEKKGVATLAAASRMIYEYVSSSQ